MADRITQIVAEELIVATAKARITQIVAEDLIVATAHARVTQIVAEILCTIAPPFLPLRKSYHYVDRITPHRY